MLKMNRRHFLSRGMALAGLSASNRFLGSGLGLLSQVAMASSQTFTDHKALVMVFLTGGIDSLGLLIPASNDGYSRYQTIRQQLAIPQAELLDFGLPNYGAPPWCDAMVNMYQRGDLAWVSNVGPLRQPTTKAMIENNAGAMPIFIGSHNSQQILWQSGSMNPNAREGWGARMLELMQLNSSLISPSISLDRSQLFTTTLATPTFTVDPWGVRNIPIIGDETFDQDNFARTQFYHLQQQNRSSLLGREVAARHVLTLENSAFLKDVLAQVPATAVTYPTATGYSAASFQRQLQMAARLIEAAPILEQPRQVIMVQMHGFDTHDNQDRDLPNLVSALFGNLMAFQDDLATRSVAENVVTFSQSDFGRTPTINANGTDHGWGGHYFIVGEPVIGGKVVGNIPRFDVETDNMLYNLSIPDISVEQYAANLARWFGLSKTEIRDVFPGLVNFDDVDFGVLA